MYPTISIVHYSDWDVSIFSNLVEIYMNSKVLLLIAKNGLIKLVSSLEIIVLYYPGYLAIAL